MLARSVKETDSHPLPFGLANLSRIARASVTPSSTNRSPALAYLGNLVGMGFSQRIDESFQKEFFRTQ